jgi:guanosine-3',5'-bis(diphosphate) 3'-pyrophosphohydrolase
MPDTLRQRYLPLLEAVSFAARAHHGQMRKDKATPYVSHVFRVTLIVRDIFGIRDRQALLAALLHDTVEDTLADFDELEERFGRELAEWVALLSKDKRQREPERESAYVAQLVRAPWQVKACKLADVFDNLMDLPRLPPEKQARGLDRARQYLEAIKPKLPPELKRPYGLVRRLVQETAAKLGPAAP